MKKYLPTFFGVIVLLALLEVASRIVLSRIYNRSFDSSLIVDNKYLTSSGLKESASGMVWGKPFHTDSFGCRKSTRPYNSKKKKWLFIGDSVAEGVGVDDSATFAALVAAKVDSVNIMNYSLIGYSDADYLNVLKMLFSKYDSSISKVTIFFCLNDVYGSVKSNGLPVMAKPNLIGRLNGLMQNSYATYKLLKLIVYQNSDRYFKYDEQFYEAGNPYFTEAMQRLKDCDSVCTVAGVKLNVVMMPYRTQFAGHRKPQLLVKQYCDKQHIGFDDVLDKTTFPPFGQRFYLFADEIHFSEAGHKMIADYILSH